MKNVILGVEGEVTVCGDWICSRWGRRWRSQYLMTKHRGRWNSGIRMLWRRKRQKDATKLERWVGAREIIRRNILRRTHRHRETRKWLLRPPPSSAALITNPMINETF